MAEQMRTVLELAKTVREWCNDAPLAKPPYSAIIALTDAVYEFAPVTDDERERRALAMAAASQCGEALTTMVQFAREGGNYPDPFGDDEPIEKLADALKMTIELAALCGDTISDRDELLSALVKFLEGWMG